MKEHPFIAGMIIGLCIIAAAVIVSLLFYPELIFIFKSVNTFFTA